jgi:predicted ester cyclase
MKTTSFLMGLVLLTTQLTFAQKHEQTIRSFYAAVDAGDFDKAGSFLAEDLKVSLPLSPEVLDKAGYRQIGMSMYAGFPNMKHEVREVTSGKNTAAFIAHFKGTNRGSLMGNPPTGNQVESTFLGYLKFNDKGKINKIDLQFDLASFNAQLTKGLPDPKAIAEKNVRELYDLMDSGQTARFGEYCAPDFRISNPFLPTPAPIEAFQGILQTQKTAFPDDMKHEILEIYSDGKVVVTSGIFKGTNTGSMMGNSPTGNKVSLPFLVLDHVDANGKIVSRNVLFDNKAFESQLMAGIGSKD